MGPLAQSLRPRHAELLRTVGGIGYSSALEQSARKGLPVKGLQVVDAFADADQLNGQIHLFPQRHDDAAFSRTVQLGQSETAQLGGVVKLARLGQGILTVGRV